MYDTVDITHDSPMFPTYKNPIRVLGAFLGFTIIGVLFLAKEAFHGLLQRGQPESSVV